MAKIAKEKARKKRQQRIRNKVYGTAQRPRLNVYKSLNHIYAQLIDDEMGNTLVSSSTLDPSIKAEIEKGYDTEAAKIIGKAIAQKATKEGIEKVVFDRSGYIYHGKVKALAESARENGLKF